MMKSEEDDSDSRLLYLRKGSHAVFRLYIYTGIFCISSICILQLSQYNHLPSLNTSEKRRDGTSDFCHSQQ